MKHTSKEVLREVLSLYTKTYHIKGAGLHTFIYRGGFAYTESTKHLLMSFSADKKNKEEALRYFLQEQQKRLAEMERSGIPFKIETDEEDL